MANRLANETSPYLLQHQHNPVDWYPWGEEALRRARDEDRPLLVSIGYSACHWCHVMERESFENEETAALMNELFVCIKVDREERPDVDAIYMEACQTMTGQGGWPLNAFISPQQVPFYVGTYFPPEARHGMPSWRTVLRAVADAWATRRSEIDEQSQRLTAALRASTRIEPSPDPIDEQQLKEAAGKLAESYDWQHGGWGGAPKFPMSSSIEFLLARGLTDAPLHALRQMAQGGIYDQVGGGFARYAVDATWTVPHFEKMLYDNALLARAYLHGWQTSNDPRLEEVCRETLDWALREMRGPEGGFCSALDADSEGVEGKFYVWRLEELQAALGDDAAAAVAYFGATAGGNFEGHGLNVLEARGPRPERLAEIRNTLLAARGSRVRPGLDDKRLTAWNALMISALAEAGAVLEHVPYLEAASQCAAFVLTDLRDEQGHLLRTWKDGRARLDAYLEDHAFLLEALLTLYEASFYPRWYREAVALAEQMIARFHDDANGGFFTTAADHEQLLLRRKDLEDSPIPSGSSSAAFGLLRLGALSGDARYEEYGREVLALMFGLAARHPGAFGHLLRAADFYASPVREIAIVGSGDSAEELLKVVRERLRPHIVLAASAAATDDGVPLLAGRTTRAGGAANAYVCERFACQAPVSDPDSLRSLLD
jgi:uncharacterized protein YyaL (SSP411 family)